MVTQKDGVNLLKFQFPQLRQTKRSKFETSLSLLAHEVDDAINKRALNTVSRIFDCVNYLINNGSAHVKRLVHQYFFRQLKAIPVYYPPQNHPVQGPFEMEIIKKYRIHYRICRKSGCWSVKSINIDL